MNKENKTEKIKKRFNIEYSEIGKVYYLMLDGKTLVIYPTSKEAKYRRDLLIKELEEGK